MTRKGLYLQGGGAKGAYQAGVMLALHEAGVEFEALAGTSIGSINGHFWASGKMDQLEELWMTMEIPERIITEDHLFLNNEFLLDAIDDRFSEVNQVRNWFVNYAEVKDQKLYNRYEDLRDLSHERRLEVVGYSTRLPLRDENKKYDLSLYEGMRIDGGMINNAFVEPLTQMPLDEIVIIPLNNHFESPALEEFSGKVTRIMPPMTFEKGDTVRLEQDVIRTWFEKGYEAGKLFV